MKGFFRTILVNFLSLLVIAKTLGAISYSESFLVLFWASVTLTLFNLLVKPLLNLLLMPINLLTLGAFKWVVNAIVLFLVTMFVEGFKILDFTFPGISFAGFIIPTLPIPFFWSLILISFCLEVISGFIFWIFK